MNFKNFLLSKRLSLSSIQVYEYWGKVFTRKYGVRFCEQDVFQFKNDCLMRYQVASQRTIFVSVNYLLEFNGMSIRIALPSQNLTFKKGIINEKQFQKIIDNLVCENFFISVRNRELLKLLWNTGLRIGEAINLKWRDISHTYIKVTSKNNRTRFIPYKHDLFDSLKMISPKNGPYVITTQSGSKLSYKGAWKIFHDLNIKNFSPHSLRHSFATRLIKNGIALSFVSNMLGHTSLNTTAIYLHFQLDDLIAELTKKDWN